MPNQSNGYRKIHQSDLSEKNSFPNGSQKKVARLKVDEVICKRTSGNNLLIRQDRFPEHAFDHYMKYFQVLTPRSLTGVGLALNTGAWTTFGWFGLTAQSTLCMS